jgi:tRNA/tmRNA/rRNA uracil-C5-methylase (TrmA/RlmC/RlmD family)
MHPTAYNVLRTDPELRPGCDCNVGTRPGVVLDPFFGTGTVGAVARELGRDWIGIEINPEYVRLAEQRLAHVQPRTEAA